MGRNGTPEAMGARERRSQLLRSWSETVENPWSSYIWGKTDSLICFRTLYFKKRFFRQKIINVFILVSMKR